MKKSRIPDTDSIEELARFWETHDLTDFEDELEEVTEPIFAPRLRTTLLIRLEPQEVEAIKEIAKSRGVEQTDLVREWVREKLHQRLPTASANKE